LGAEAWLRQFLGLSDGIPGHDTIRRVFESLAGRVRATLPELGEHEAAGRVIAIDGKIPRGSGRVR
jgi:hypothetical protein